MRTNGFVSFIILTLIVLGMVSSLVWYGTWKNNKRNLIGISYPRVAMYSWLRSNGSPFSSGGVIDTAAVETQAKWDIVVMEPARTGASRTVQAMLKEFNPNMALLAFFPTMKFFVCGTGWYGQVPPPVGCDTTGNNMAWSRWRAIRAFDGVLYSTNGGPYLGGGWIDFTRPGLPAALADTAANWLTPVHEGIFSDESCLSITWTQGYGDTIDYTRSGYPSLADWDVAYRAGMKAYFTRLRTKLVHRLSISNCGQCGYDSLENGHMRENFPWQNGGTWEKNMLGGQGGPCDHGYFGDDTLKAPPAPLNWLTAWADNGNGLATDPYNQQRARYTIASATLASGVGTLTYDPGDVARGYSPQFWWDEYAVNATGQSVNDMAYKGWLGAPLGPAVKVGVVWRREFENGLVLVNPSASPVTVTAGANYYRIQGVLATGVNNGSPATTTVVPAGDALFLQYRP
jgi:hypothetical protein